MSIGKLLITIKYMLFKLSQNYKKFQVFALWKGLLISDNTINEDITVDIGCGTEQYRSFVNGKYISIDLMHKPKIKADAQKLPLRNSCCTRILAYDIIEHLSDDNRFIEECSRILKKGGVIFLSTPNYWSKDAWGDPHHLRTYSYKSLLRKLTRQGFKCYDKSYYAISRLPSDILRSLFWKSTYQIKPYNILKCSEVLRVWSWVNRFIEVVTLSLRFWLSRIPFNVVSTELIIMGKR